MKLDLSYLSDCKQQSAALENAEEGASAMAGF
jgi:hypothetical protein